MLKRDDNIYSRIGIYGIRNLINGKIYVGKTGMNFGDRWDSHRSLLNNGKHDNPHLQRAWDKYGQDNFEFIVIEDCSIDELSDREKYYIKKYKDVGFAYNIHDGGDEGYNLGKHLSDETKRKRYDILRGIFNYNKSTANKTTQKEAQKALQAEGLPP